MNEEMKAKQCDTITAAQYVLYQNLKAENVQLRAALEAQRECVIRLREGFSATIPVIRLTQDSIDAIDKALQKEM